MQRDAEHEQLGGGSPGFWRRFPDALAAGIVILALGLIDCLIGGTRLLFSVPSYGLIALAGLVGTMGMRRARSAASRTALMASGVFFGYVILRCLTSPVGYLSRHDLWMVVGALIVYLLFCCRLVHPRYRLAFVAGLLVLGMANVGVGLMQALKERNFMPISFLQRADYGWRASGFYICPNHLSGFLEIVVLMGLGVVCWGKWRPWVKVIAGYAVVVCMGGIVLSISRGGLLSITVGMLTFCGLSVLMVWKTIPHARWVLLPGILGLLAVAVPLGFWGMHQVEDRGINPSNAFTADVPRFEMAKAAFKEFELSPLVGTGSWTYYYYGRRFREPTLDQDPKYVHDDYLELLAEYGVVGAAASLLFLAAHMGSGAKGLAEAVRKRRQAKDRNSVGLTIGALSVVADYMVHSMVDFNLHVPANTLCMAFVFGILASPRYVRQHTICREDKVARFAIPALAAWVLLAGVPMLPGEYWAEKARVALRDLKLDEAIADSARGLAHEHGNPLMYLYSAEAKALRAELGSGVFQGAPQADKRGSEKDLLSAVSDYQGGLELFPQDKALLVGLGMALDELKRYREADPVFERALAADPNDDMNRFHYAEHLYESGRLDEAAVQYERSLALRNNPAAAAGLQKVAQARMRGGDAMLRADR